MTTSAGRRLLPRTLLWQTFALLALMLVLAFIGWSQMVRHFEQAPRARDLAQTVSSIVNLTRTALINADARRRLELLIDMTALEGIRVRCVLGTEHTAQRDKVGGQLTTLGKWGRDFAH